MRNSITHLKELAGVSRLTERQRRIYQYLQDNPVAVLSTYHPEYGPHGSVIYFDIKPNFEISFVTRIQTQKHKNLQVDDRVMLTVYEPVSQTVAEISGNVVEVEEEREVNGIAGAILKRSLKTTGGGLLPISKLRAGPYTAYMILPTHIRMAMYANAEPGEYEAIFDSIESYEVEGG